MVDPALMSGDEFDTTEDDEIPCGELTLDIRNSTGVTEYKLSGFSSAKHQRTGPRRDGAWFTYMQRDEIEAKLEDGVWERTYAVMEVDSS